MSEGDDVDVKTVAIEHALQEFHYDPADVANVVEQLWDLAWHAGYTIGFMERGVICP